MTLEAIAAALFERSRLPRSRGIDGIVWEALPSLHVLTCALKIIEHLRPLSAGILGFWPYLPEVFVSRVYELFGIVVHANLIRNVHFF
jgi:hypothetical protein